MRVVLPPSIVHMWYRVHMENTDLFNEKKNSTLIRISLARGKKEFIAHRKSIVTCGDKTIQGGTILTLFPLSIQFFMLELILLLMMKDVFLP